MGEVMAITRHAVRNYGSVLQSLATQLLISRNGGEPTFIDYRQPGVDDTARSYAPVHNGRFGPAKKLAYTVVRSGDAKTRGRRFEAYIQSNLNLTENVYNSFDDLTEEAFNSSSSYCVGSDQVWNVEYNTDNRPYYLEFAPEGSKRFSLSSSIGMDVLPKSEEIAFARNLRNFSGISVRETGAAEYIQKLGFDAEVHVDPTLALSTDDWKQMASINSFPQPYLLVYQLNANRDLQDASLLLAKKLGIRIMRIEYWKNLRGRGAKSHLLPSVPDFLSLFLNASLVLTDSFHGCAFSLNFGKPFVVMLPKKYNSRITSLLELAGVPHRLATTAASALDIVMTEPDLPETDSKLDASRKSLQLYIQRMLAT